MDFLNSTQLYFERRRVTCHQTLLCYQMTKYFEKMYGLPRMDKNLKYMVLVTLKCLFRVFSVKKHWQQITTCLLYLFSFSSMNSWSLSSGYCTTLTRTGCALWRSLRTSCTLKSSLHINDITSWFMSFMPSSSSSVSVPEGTSDESTWVTDLVVIII